MTEVEIADKLYPEDGRKHPAWHAFVREMRFRQYGAEPLSTAWGFYKKGWEALREELK